MNAVETLLQALNEEPGDLTAHSALADALEDAGRSEQAEVARWQSRFLRGETSAEDNGHINELLASGVRPVTGPWVNSIGMRFVLVGPGTFLMGSPLDEADRRENETQHEVTITKGFYLGVYPVTQGQWMAVMGDNPSWFSRTGGGKDKVKKISDADLELFPVETTSWEDAQDFLNKLAARDEEAKIGRKYRLPREADWEYSCRGGHLIQDVGSKHALPFHFEHPTSSLSSTQANFHGDYPYGDGGKGPYLGRTSKVGVYKPNALGLFDMHGNVYEWCVDWYDENYYKNSPAADPPGASVGSGRVFRGGSWDDFGRSCRAAYRSRYAPEGRFDDLGFRVAVPLQEQNGEASGGGP